MWSVDFILQCTRKVTEIFVSSQSENISPQKAEEQYCLKTLNLINNRNTCKAQNLKKCIYVENPTVKHIYRN
jgi:hypothetical protein